MKTTKKSRKNPAAIIALIVSVVLVCTVLVVYACAATSAKTDAMIEIESKLSAYKVGDTVSVADDGYIGIPVKVSTYYDTAKGVTKPGYNGTPLIVYVVNTNIERIGKKTDVEIIESLLDRGYIVQIFDYLNSDKAVSPDLDWSTQKLRQKSKSGSYFTDNTYLKAGTYYDTILIPAGYDVSLSNVFWETDKHGADGDLEKIVENWNTDLRSWFRDTVVYWRNSEGVQKATQKGFDGSAVVWYSDAKGTQQVEASASNANYVKLQHTLAFDITDCVGKDGTPVDLNLYMHVAYPTNKNNTLEAVPVIALANSSEYLSNGLNTADRPQFSGFLFNGYAGVIFDYLYQPMAQSDYYGYYDGRTALGAMTGDHMNYGLQLYDDKRINTAAIRYVRYLTLTQPDVYSFDVDSIGAYGNSKGGWFSFLGEAELKEYTTVPSGKTLAEAMDTRINSYISKRTYENTKGETRYQRNKTEAYTRNGVTIDGGELQPWLTYKDKSGVEHEILSYVSWTYASCGSQHEDVSENHSPLFAALQMQDDFNTTHNLFAEISANLDIPSIYVIVDDGHTFAYGSDYYHGFNIYNAMFDFANYYLKNSAVKVIYTDPAANSGKLDTTPSITVKFTGGVSKSEIEKITLVSGSHTATGEWTSVRGNTEWTFKADALIPGAKYVLTVPANVVGENGTAMGTAYTTTFFTENEDVSGVTVTKGTAGNYFTITVPEDRSSDAKIRFHVANDAANIAELYAVSGFNAASPDSSTKGALVGSVNLSGSGYYEIDVTKQVYEAEAGSSLTFLLAAKKTAGYTDKLISFESAVSGVSFGAFVRGSADKAPDGTGAAKVYVTPNIRSNGNLQYPNERPYYVNLTTAMTINQLFGSTLTESDLGRKYTVTMRVYDTDTRYMQVSLNRVSGTLVHDKDAVNYIFKTEANKWQDISFDYTVYEPNYGAFGLNPKTLTVALGHTGSTESPIYVRDILITETVTGIDLAADGASLVLGERGGEYKKDSTSKAFTIGSTGYDTFKAALTAAKSGDTVVMNKNYTFTDSDDFTGWGSLEKITLNLNGYKLYSDSSKPIIHASATSVTKPKTTINVTGGEIYLSGAALIGYSGTTVAGDGKTFDVNISGTGILNATGSTLTEFITESDVTSGASISVNVKLDSASVDFTRSINAKTPIKLLSNGSAALSVSYEICGGSIYVDNFANLTFVDTFKKSEFTKSSDGKYTALTTGAGTKVPDIAVTTESSIATYKLSATENNIATYTVQASALSTKYGLIPEEYASVDNYPFVMFDENGNFKGAYDRWLGDNGSGSILGAARNYVENAWNGTSYGANPKEAFIVMRRDYTFDAAKDKYFNNLAHIQGAINIDLGGFTLANSSAVSGKGIFPADSKGLSSAAGEKIFPTTIRVTNGAIRTYNYGVVQASTWDSMGGGTIANKDFNFIFNKVTLGFVKNPSGAGLLFHRNSATSTSVAAPFNMTFNDCVIDTTTSKSSHSCTIFKLNAPTNQYVQANYVVNGGKIITDGVSTITIAEFNSDGSATHGSSIVFGKGENGEYTSYYIPESSTKTLAVGKWNSSDGNVLGFIGNGTESIDGTSYKRYTLDINPLVTKYGTIPEDKKDAEANPFAVFSRDASGNYKYDSSYSTLKSAVGRAKTINCANVWDATNKTYGASEVSSVVLFRRNYTATSTDNYNDYGQNQGTILIDLNGFTLTQGSGSNSAFATITAKGWSGSGDAYVFPSTFNVINGKILVNDKPVIAADTWHTVTGNGEMAAKTFTWNFDSVEFGFVEGATSEDLLVSYKNPQSSAGEVKIPFVFNYNDCTFDMTNAPSGAKLFNAATSTSLGKWIQSTITVKGGEIKAPSLSYSQLYSIDDTNTYGSSIKFVKDANGEYTKLYVTNGGTAPVGDIPTDAGDMCYAKLNTGSSETLYTLSSLKTPYGTIPADKASIEDYPFVVFDTDGIYYGAFSNLHKPSSSESKKSAMNTAIYTVLRDYNKWDPATGEYVPDEGSTGVKTAIIYMRRDYTLTSAEFHENLAHTQGTIVLDLGGFTIYSDSSRTIPMFDAIGKGWSGTDDGNKVFPCTFAVKNGEIKTHSASVIRFTCNDSVGGNAIANKAMNFTFENVTFGLVKGATIASPIISVADAKTTSGTLPANVTFSDCTFDFETVAPTVETTIFNAAFESKYYVKGTIVINGGKLLANGMANIKLYSLDTSRGSSITFGKGSDGKYFEVHLDSGAAAPAFTYICKTSSGETTLTYSSAKNGKDIYTLQASIATKYGNIPARFASVDKYPFAVFRNGQFVIATSLFAKDAAESALHSSKSAGSIVLMRRDFTYAEAQYNNLSQTYSVTIDLGGFTFISNSDKQVFYAQKKTDHDTTITVINGTMLTSAAPIVRYASWGANGKYPGGRNFTISFEGVTLGAVAGTNPAVLIATANKNLSEPLTYGHLNITNCTIDLTGLTTTTLFDLADPSGIIRVEAEVVGGEIRANSLDGIKIGNVVDEYNSLTFVKADGEYTELYLKQASAIPTEKLDTAEGKLSFVRSANDGEWAIYKLSASSLNEFKPKISVTLYSDFIFNIYIPATDDVESIEFCGTVQDISKLERKTVDGKEFYVLHKEQAPSTAAEEFSFRVGLNTGDKTVYGNWTVSIVKYANLVLNDTESTEVEKTLVKDILSYVRSAYIYFKRENAADVKAKIDAVIGADYDTTARPTDMEAAQVGGGFDSATFRLDAKPSFVFYPETDAEGKLVYDVEAYRFTQNGKPLVALKTTVDGRACIVITTYAYAIDDNISYSIDGTEISGEFNIKAYYEFAKTQNNDALVNIVERLWRYSESAEAYKIEATLNS